MVIRSSFSRNRVFTMPITFAFTAEHAHTLDTLLFFALFITWGEGALSKYPNGWVWVIVLTQRLKYLRIVQDLYGRRSPEQHSFTVCPRLPTYLAPEKVVIFIFDYTFWAPIFCSLTQWFPRSMMHEVGWERLSIRLSCSGGGSFEYGGGLFYGSGQRGFGNLLRFINGSFYLLFRTGL